MRDTAMMVLYIVISTFALVADCYTAHKCFKEKKQSAVFLGITCIVAGLTQIFYLSSVFCKGYFWFSFFSSLYFIAVSWTLVAVFVFFRLYMKNSFSWLDKVSFIAVLAYLLFDSLIMALNPYNEVAIDYIPNGHVLAPFSYHPQALYWLHIIFAYFLIIGVFVNLHRGGVQVPKEYRKPYSLSIISLFAVVVLNAVFLFFPNVMGSSNLDYSIWGYSLAAFTIYQHCFTYRTDGMKPYYHSWIVENINQGVALFDYMDNLTIANEKLNQLFPNINCESEQTIDSFTKQLGITLNSEKREYNYSFQFYVNNDGKSRTVRLDHRCLKGKHNELLGQLLVFTDEVGDIDLLTSFYNWSYFKNDLMNIPGSFEDDSVIAVFDINGLGLINTEYGRDNGDKAITIVSEHIRKLFPMESHFIRGHEASLIVVSYNMGFEDVERRIDLISKNLDNDDRLGFDIDIQSATSIKHKDQTILDAIKVAFKSLQNKKLLDINSPKSELVRSIVKALEEVDSDTEEHVKRTQAMGYELGKRLNLTDVQLSDLALLCLLHDIGKVGIPLNILNKPGKLTDEEWVVMKSHTKKGYQIARSAKELVDISEMILHHHEKWDGTGYPDGLSKDAIPLLSRIISVVDSYDAMVSNRPYRKGMSIDKAIAELKHCAGTQFDPKIVDEFVNMIPEIVPEETASKEETLVMASQVFRKVEVVNYDTSRVHGVDYCRYLLDDQNKIVDVNTAFESLTGYTKEDVIKLKLSQEDLIPEEDRAGYFMLVTEQLNKNNIAYFEHRIKCKSGLIKSVLCMGRVYYDSAALAQRSEVIVVDTQGTHAVQELIAQEKSKSQVSFTQI
ncbi:MAG: HD domain-containing protein [Saccharofermentans sp.]|nr:HD domain-containing protein [Saccharofermentans sp.]